MSYGQDDFSVDYLEGRGTGRGGALRLGMCGLLLALWGMILAVAWGLGYVRQHGELRFGGEVVAIGLSLLNGYLVSRTYQAMRVKLPVVLWLLAVAMGFGSAALCFHGECLGAGDGSSFDSIRERCFSSGPFTVMEVVRTLGIPLLLLLGTLVCGGMFQRRAFFCEACGQWGRERALLMPLYLRVPAGTAFAILARGTVSPLLSASPVASGTTGVALAVQICYCPDCRHGAMWVLEIARGGRRRVVKGLQGIPLEAEAVRALLEIVR